MRSCLFQSLLLSHGWSFRVGVSLKRRQKENWLVLLGNGNQPTCIDLILNSAFRGVFGEVSSLALMSVSITRVFNWEIIWKISSSWLVFCLKSMSFSRKGRDSNPCHAQKRAFTFTNDTEHPTPKMQTSSYLSLANSQIRRLSGRIRLFLFNVRLHS